MDRGPWMLTFTGKRYHFLDPSLEEIDIVDIDHALSRKARFNGHTRGGSIYSVAKHSVLTCVRFVSSLEQPYASDVRHKLAWPINESFNSFICLASDHVDLRG